MQSLQSFRAVSGGEDPILWDNRTAAEGKGGKDSASEGADGDQTGLGKRKNN